MRIAVAIVLKAKNNEQISTSKSDGYKKNKLNKNKRFIWVSVHLARKY